MTRRIIVIKPNASLLVLDSVCAPSIDYTGGSQLGFLFSQYFMTQASIIDRNQACVTIQPSASIDSLLSSSKKAQTNVCLM